MITRWLNHIFFSLKFSFIFFFFFFYKSLYIILRKINDFQSYVRIFQSFHHLLISFHKKNLQFLALKFQFEPACTLSANRASILISWQAARFYSGTVPVSWLVVVCVCVCVCVNKFHKVSRKKGKKKRKRRGEKKNWKKKWETRHAFYRYVVTKLSSISLSLHEFKPRYKLLREHLHALTSFQPWLIVDPVA